MKTKILLICALSLLVSIPALAAPCSGEKYEGHPALVEECQHQRTINANNPYPGPDVPPVPYPPPIMATPAPTYAPIPTFDADPTIIPLLPIPKPVPPLGD